MESHVSRPAATARYYHYCVYYFDVTNSLVQVQRRKQIFAFLLPGSETVAAVKTKISAVAAQHDIAEAADDAVLLLTDGKRTAADATLASLAEGVKKVATEGLKFHLVYSIGDDEYEPVEVVPTRTD